MFSKWKIKTIGHFQQAFSPADIYLFKISNRSTRKRCEICSKLTIKTIGHFQQAFSPADIYLFKISNRSTRKRCEICSKLTIKTPELRYWCYCSVFIVNFECFSNCSLVFLLLTWNKYMLAANTLWWYFHSLSINVLSK